MKEGALIAKTINHIGAVDEERKRIETAGGVCREDAPGHFRLFLPGEAFLFPLTRYYCNEVKKYLGLL